MRVKKAPRPNGPEATPINAPSLSAPEQVETPAWKTLLRMTEVENMEKAGLSLSSDVSQSVSGQRISPSSHVKGAAKMPEKSDNPELQGSASDVPAIPTKPHLNATPEGFQRRERSESPRGPRREHIPGKSEGSLPVTNLIRDESKRRSREMKTLKSYPESSSPAVREKSSTQPEGEDESDIGPTRLRGKSAKSAGPGKTLDVPKALGTKAAAKVSSAPAVRKKTSTKVPVQPKGEDEPDMGPTRLRGKYAKSAFLDDNLDNVDVSWSKPMSETSGKTAATKVKPKPVVNKSSTKKKAKVDGSRDFIIPTKESEASLKKKDHALWKENVAQIGLDVYGNLSKKSGKSSFKAGQGKRVENDDEKPSKLPSVVRQLSTTLDYDDSDNNEGNDDPLTSLKQDSGSNRDDISFGGLSAPPEILARGPRARRAYAEAAQAGTKKVFRTRLMLVGQERVGKTSLKKTLTGQGFDENEAITDGVETTNSCEISIEVAKAGGKMWSIHKKGHENEDTKEDEYSKALADEIAKRLIVAPPQNQESSEPLSDTTDGRGLNPEEAEDFVLDTVEAPKAKEEDDNMPNQIASLVEKMLKEQVRLKEIGTARTDNGREGVSLSIWDFAGHDIYYTTHQVFLTWRAIYVIVFDLSRSLDSVVPPESRDEYYEMAKGGAKSELTCLEFINFWLCSIFAHAVAPSSVRSKNTSKTAQKSPPIFIVGTHRESVKGDAKEKKKKIDSAFGKIRKSIKKKPFECHVVPKYYAIENSLEDKDEELVELRRHIEKVAMEEPYIGEEIPLRWLLFEEALAADKINYMSLDQMKELTQPVGMESERELLTMLTFYHDLGYVVYYGGIEDQQSLLRDMVILNPQWLIDVFKQVITILDPAERDGIVSDAWTTLEEDGILEDRLIQHMWQGFLEQKEALVKLMAKFDLICEAPVEQLQQEQQDGLDAEVSNETEVVKKRYYVPSRLTSHCSLEEIGQIKSSTDFYVDFRGFLPDGLFHRLMTRAVRWMGERDGEPVILFYRQISLMVDEEHHALLEMLPCHEATIKVTVFQGAVADSDDDGDSHQPPAQSAVKEVMDFVTSTLDSLRQHWAKRIQYDVCFLCPKCSKKKLFQDCFKRKSLQCGLHRIRTAAVKSKFGMSEEGVESGNESPMICRRSTFKESNVLCDLYFSNLAEQIGSEWHRLGIRLGLNQADIEHITEDKLTAVDRILSLLQLWKKRSSCTDKRKMVEELCKALSSCDRRDLAGDVKEAAGIS
eukprot:XP_011668998.1 PREDICTED: uncharacterized protein LOC752124 isoform X1 [Strongylocentrotus purpuratus]